MLKRNRLSLALAAAVMFTVGPALAQSTSAALGGRVTDPKGGPIAGAQIEITHVPSGTRTLATTDADGRYVVRGLRVGGPFTVKATAPALEEAARSDIYSQLDTNVEVDLLMASKAALETIEVVATATSYTFMADNMGATTTVTRAEIDAFPSVRRTLEDYVRFDPRIVQIDKERGGLSAGGQNNRYNNIKIDGVPTNDQFGLNDSGLPALNQPISIDWIQEFNIGITKFDVTQSDFVGANINAVTKSGGNEFHGGVYGVYRDADMVGKDENDNEFKGFDDEWTAGGYVSGPIIQDKLFFFAGYEKFERSAPGAAVGITGSGFPNEIPITQAQLDQIRTIAAGYGLGDIGGQSPSADNTDEKWFAKLDWNLNDDHRASFRYNKTEGQALRLSTSSTLLQLDSNYYQDNISFENYALLFYNRWSDRLSTEANIAYAEYRSLPSPFSLYPQITVNTNTTNGVTFGRERSRHANELAVDTVTAFFAADLALGDHTLKFGADYEDNDVFNLFLQDLYGTYDFASIADFQSGRYNRYRLQQPANGEVDSVAASFGVSVVGLFLQDTWQFSDQLTFTYGVRVDSNYVDGVPRENVLARQVFGYDNTKTIDGQRTVEPRFGFNYQFDTERLTQLRGGVGLFQGSAPGVWVSNSFSNPGGLATAYDFRPATGTTPPPLSFDPNNPLIPSTVSPAQLVNFLDDDFQQPTVWKSNLAFEHELPWWGMIGSVEYILTQVDKAIAFQNLNLGGPTGTLPDGRPTFFANLTPANFLNNRVPTVTAGRDTRFTNAILLSNSDQGHAQTATISLTKPFSNDWFWKIGYTYTEANEVTPGTSSVALSNWQNRALFNPLEYENDTANYELRDRFTAQLRKTFRFFDDAPTSFGMFYEGRSGRPYSYVFTGDANGDGQSFNDLFFVPDLATAQYSTNSTAQDIAAFESYITGNTYLNDRQGQVTRRNGSRAPWVNYVDLHVSQKIPLFAETKAEVFLNILNFGNLLNKSWGQIDEQAFPYTRGVARMGGVANGDYVYDVSAFANETTGAVNNPRGIRKDVAGESRWTIQVGFRFEF